MAGERYSLKPLIIGLSIPLMFLSVLFVCLRIHSKAILRKLIRVDDWLIFVALVFTLGVSSLPLISLNYDLGLRFIDANPANLSTQAKIVYANGLLYPTAVGATKISILMGYLTLFPSRNNKWFCYITMGFIIVYTVLCFILSMIGCRPIEAIWDTSIKGECLNEAINVYVGASLNSANDLLVYLWPIRPLWKLQMPAKQRYGLIALFSIGVVVCVVGLLRIYFLTQLLAGGDFLLNAVPIWLCSTTEVCLGIICACLTSVKPTMALIFPTIFASSAQSHGTKSRKYLHYGTRSGHRHAMGATGTNETPETFVFEQLSSKQRDQAYHSDGLDLKDALKTATHDANNIGNSNDGTSTNGRSMNGVWVNISNDQRGPKQHGVPSNAIGVREEITVDNSAAAGRLGATKPRSLKEVTSDTGSEEWILYGGTERARSRQN